MKIGKNKKDCENCFYYGRMSDAPESVKKDCMYAMDHDEDEEGFIINEPPCERH